jgi:hypothetical protein
MTTENLTSLDPRLDAIADNLRQLVPGLATAQKVATPDPKLHAYLHRAHRPAHDFICIVDEERRLFGREKSPAPVPTKRAR